MLSRRHALQGSAVAAVATAANHALAQTTGLSARIQLGGQSYNFDEAAGRDLGDFVSPIGGFTQRCIRAQAAGCPITVFFRPDRNSERVEVVFELGTAFNSTPANLGAYTVTIARAGITLATVDVPAHYWFSRWRWQSSARPVVGNIDQLISQGLLPPYDRSAVTGVVQTSCAIAAIDGQTQVADVTGGSPRHLSRRLWSGTSLATALLGLGGRAFAAKPITSPGKGGKGGSTGTTDGGTTTGGTTTGGTTTGGSTTGTCDTALTIAPAVMTTFTPYTVMGLAGITAYMPQTGERPDIGLVTEPQAQFICTGAQAPLDQLRAQAEGAGTVPWHVRDDQTGAPLNLRTYPQASCYWDSRAGNPWVATIGSAVTVDTAHVPALAYLPYVLTGDPYHLEDLQFMANYAWLSQPAAYRPAVVQSRAFAWYLRSLAQAVRVTPATVPSWLLPQSYWAGFLADNRVFLEATYVNNPGPVTAVFRSTGDIANSRDEGATAPGGTWVDPWQEEFLAAVMGWMLAMGFTDWRTAFDWKIGSTIARTGTTSGWSRAHATPYRMILRASNTSPLVTQWGEAYSLTSTTAQWPATTDPNVWPDPDMTYLAYSRGALVMASRTGSIGIRENVTWATTQLNAGGWRTAYKWRLV